MPALTTRARTTTVRPIFVTLGILVIVPAVVGSDMEYALTIGLIYAIACVGLDIFVGYTGQLSFGTFAFVGVAAYMSGGLASDHGWPIWATLPAAVAISALIGALLSIPAVVIPHLGSALVTFFFSYVVYQALLGPTLADFTHSSNGLVVQGATFLGTSLTVGTPTYYLALCGVAVALLATWRYANSSAGKRLRLVKRSAVVAAANGVAVNRMRRAAMTYTTALAGLAGFVYGQAVGFLSPESFATVASVNLMAMAVIGGLGSVIGPLYGAIFYAVLTQATTGTGGWTQVIFPAAVLLTLVVFPDGIYGLGERGIGLLRGLRAKWQGTSPSNVVSEPPRDMTALPPKPSPEALLDAAPILVVTNCSKTYGGVKALQDVSFAVNAGEIRGIMGPNGAGKTTLLDCISGVQSSEGSIAFDDAPLTGMTIQAVRQSGLARTFQHPALAPDLSVIENITLGAAIRYPAYSLAGYIPTRSGCAADRAANDSAHNILDQLGFSRARRDILAGELSLAEQKLVDIARALVGRPKLVLLDEPTAGLDEEEMHETARALLRVRALGVTVVVIAHHVGFLRTVADNLTVLDFGKVLASGTPDQILGRTDVMDIYLGVADGDTAPSH